MTSTILKKRYLSHAKIQLSKIILFLVSNSIDEYDMSELAKFFDFYYIEKK